MAATIEDVSVHHSSFNITLPAPLLDSASITPSKLYTDPADHTYSPSTPATIPSSGFADSTGGRIDRCVQAVRGAYPFLQYGPRSRPESDRRVRLF